MNFLLDTHAFLWFIGDNPQLSPKARNLLESDAGLLISAASLWEIAVKVSIGKLSLARPFDEFIPEQLTKNAIKPLPIAISHLALVSAMVFHHRDPFDRLLIAQAIVEQVPVVSRDNRFDPYGVERVW